MNATEINAAAIEALTRYSMSTVTTDTPPPTSGQPEDGLYEIVPVTHVAESPMMSSAFSTEYTRLHSSNIICWSHNADGGQYKGVRRAAIAFRVYCETYPVAPQRMNSIIATGHTTYPDNGLNHHGIYPQPFLSVLRDAATECDVARVRWFEPDVPVVFQGPEARHKGAKFELVPGSISGLPSAGLTMAVHGMNFAWVQTHADGSKYEMRQMLMLQTTLAYIEKLNGRLFVHISPAALGLDLVVPCIIAALRLKGIDIGGSAL